MARARGIWVTALALLGWLAISDARGDTGATKLQLTNCPATITFSLPELFAGGVDVTEHYNTERMATFGRVVLARTSPSKPSVLLVVSDSKRIAAKQGNFTLGDIEDIKARANQSNADRVVGKFNELFSSALMDVDHMNILAKETGDTWVAVVSEMKARREATDFRGYVAMRATLVSRCLVTALIIAPPSGVTADELMTAMRSMRFE